MWRGSVGAYAVSLARLALAIRSEGDEWPPFPHHPAPLRRIYSANADPVFIARRGQLAPAFHVYEGLQPCDSYGLGIDAHHALSQEWRVPEQGSVFGKRPRRREACPARDRRVIIGCGIEGMKTCSELPQGIQLPVGGVGSFLECGYYDAPLSSDSGVQKQSANGSCLTASSTLRPQCLH